MHTPSHKGVASGSGRVASLERAVLPWDVPTADVSENPLSPRGYLRDAQRLAAQLFGAAECAFLVNGATMGVHAMLLAAVRPGDTVVVTRHAHWSTFGALSLVGALPAYLPCRQSTSLGFIPPSLRDIRTCVSRHPKARAIVLSQPTYYGVGRPLDDVGVFCKERGIALLVDEAHGAHLPFLPNGHLRPALEAGADLVVHSLHKSLGSLVGTAQILRSATSQVSRERLFRALNLLLSTSPSHLLLASIDLVRRRVAAEGRQEYSRACSKASRLKQSLARLRRIRVVSASDDPLLKGCRSDPLRVIVDVSGLGMTGRAVERALMTDWRVTPEFADGQTVGFIVAPTDHEEWYLRIAAGFEQLSRGRVNKSAHKKLRYATPPVAPVITPPREAVFGASETVSLDDALGRIAAEHITAYPPGIPVIRPGELFTHNVVRYCKSIGQVAACVVASDASLKSVQVLHIERKVSHGPLK